MFTDLSVSTEDIENALHTLNAKVYHSIHWIAHTAYFAAVYIEGHGFYALTGGILFILTIWGAYYND